MSSSSSSSSFENREYFPSISRIPYKPDAPASESLVFRHYDANQVIHGKKMSEWLKFSMCFWHTFKGVGSDMFGTPTIKRPWESETSDPLTLSKHRMYAAFEAMTKLGIEYYTFHDRDIAPEGENIIETDKNLDEIVKIAKQLQSKTGIKLLWGTANLFTHPKYMNGASTSPSAEVFAHAAAQVKKAMDVTKELGGTGYVFWGGREGYMSLLNTDLRRELDHMGTFFKMAVAYKQKIGLNAQFLIEPKPKEPTKHQYDYDAATVIGFLHEYGLEKDFKLNIEPNHTTLAGHSYEHDVAFARRYNMLGSIDANTGDQSLGWDTDQFPSNIHDTTLVMLEVLAMGGLTTGGLNFDCKVRRESNEIEDLFVAHIGAMEAFALGLKIAARIVEDGVYDEMIKKRYSSYDSGIGKQIETGKIDFDQLYQHVVDNEKSLHVESGKQERYEQLLNYYVAKAGNK